MTFKLPASYTPLACIGEGVAFPVGRHLAFAARFGKWVLLGVPNPSYDPESGKASQAGPMIVYLLDPFAGETQEALLHDLGLSADTLDVDDTYAGEDIDPTEAAAAVVAFGIELAEAATYGQHGDLMSGLHQAWLRTVTCRRCPHCGMGGDGDVP